MFVSETKMKTFITARNIVLDTGFDPLGFEWIVDCDGSWTGNVLVSVKGGSKNGFLTVDILEQMYREATIEEIVKRG